MLERPQCWAYEGLLACNLREVQCRVLGSDYTGRNEAMNTPTIIEAQALAPAHNPRAMVESTMASAVMHHALLLELLVEIGKDKPDHEGWLIALLSRAHQRIDALEAFMRDVEGMERPSVVALARAQLDDIGALARTMKAG